MKHYRQIMVISYVCLKRVYTMISLINAYINTHAGITSHRNYNSLLYIIVDRFNAIGTCEVYRKEGTKKTNTI
jgi:hypothetical protein